jgi:hypothetical protein
MDIEVTPQILIHMDTEVLQKKWLGGDGLHDIIPLG